MTLTAKTKIYFQGELALVDEGILRFTPNSSAKEGVIISAGVHGDETAPIELLDQIISDIIEGNLSPRVHCLFILGNPKAIDNQTRFVEVNLNRLFSSSPQKNTQPSYEEERARLIMSKVEAFASSKDRITHYDLHTAIRDSRYVKFGVFPYRPARECPVHQLAFLGRSGIQALLLQNSPSTTFSGWTSEAF